MCTVRLPSASHTGGQKNSWPRAAAAPANKLQARPGVEATPSERNRKRRVEECGWKWVLGMGVRMFLCKACVFVYCETGLLVFKLGWMADLRKNRDLFAL